MVRHYTLSSEDLALIDRRRGDPNRLGFPVLLCYLRLPGRTLRQEEQPPAAMLAFIAEQLAIGIEPKRAPPAVIPLPPSRRCCPGIISKVALPRKLSCHRRALHRHRWFLRPCFAVCRALGFRFAPRIRNLKEKRLYSMPGVKVPPQLEFLVAGQGLHFRVNSKRTLPPSFLALSLPTRNTRSGAICASVSSAVCRFAARR